jgi:hypothetical protein
MRIQVVSVAAVKLKLGMATIATMTTWQLCSLKAWMKIS